jgi:hypothetical protein
MTNEQALAQLRAEAEAIARTGSAVPKPAVPPSQVQPPAMAQPVLNAQGMTVAQMVAAGNAPVPPPNTAPQNPYSPTATPDNPFIAHAPAGTYPTQPAPAPAPAPGATPAPAPTPAPNVPPAAAAPAPPPTITWRAGLTDPQKKSITDLLAAKPDPSKWTPTDLANWNYATGNMTPPNGTTPPIPGSASTGGSPSNPLVPPPVGEATGPTHELIPGDKIKWRDGINGDQQRTIRNLLIEKPNTDLWTPTDWKNWNYATNSQNPHNARFEPNQTNTAGEKQKATLIGPSGDRVEVEVGSVEAQNYMGRGYKLETGKPGERINPDWDFISQLHTIKAEIAKARIPTAEEEALQKKIDEIIVQQSNLSIGEELGVNKIKDQPIALDFLTGQEAALRRAAGITMGALTAQTLPLKQRLAFEQARRQAAFDTAEDSFKFAESEHNVLAPGTRKDDEPLTIAEAEKMGVPVGTTYGEIRGKKVPIKAGTGSGRADSSILSLAEQKAYGMPPGSTWGDAVKKGVVPSDSTSGNNSAESDADTFQKQARVIKVMVEGGKISWAEAYNYLHDNWGYSSDVIDASLDKGANYSKTGSTTNTGANYGKGAPAVISDELKNY